MSIGIEAIESCLGSQRLDNSRLAAENPDWDLENLTLRTGVKSRPIASDGETALDFGLLASEKLLAGTGISPTDLDALIFCTQTPDYIMPPNSTVLHGWLGMRPDTMAFDITLACSGFVYGVGLARGLIASKSAKRVLLVTADTYSKLIRPDDRSVRSLFGDGGCATLISEGCEHYTISDISFGTDGKKYDRFIVRNGGARNVTDRTLSATQAEISQEATSYIEMDGFAILTFFNRTVPQTVRSLLQSNGLSTDDICLFLFHQASRVALESITSALGVEKERVVIDMEDTGNLVSASIPVALKRIMDKRQLKPGDRVVLCGFGVGLSWATCIVRV